MSPPSWQQIQMNLLLVLTLLCLHCFIPKAVLQKHPLLSSHLLELLPLLNNPPFPLNYRLGIIKKERKNPHPNHGYYICIKPLG